MSDKHKHLHIGTGKFGLGFAGYFANQLGGDLVLFNRPSESEDGKLRNRLLSEGASYVIDYRGNHGRSPDHISYEAFRLLELPATEIIETISDPQTRVLTTAVGEPQLRYIAPIIAAGLMERPPQSLPLLIMACENGYRCTSTLREHVQHHISDPGNNAFLDCIVDQACFSLDLHQSEVTVYVEDYREWIIEDPDDRGQSILKDAEITLLNSKDSASHQFEIYVRRKQWLVNGFHICLAMMGAVEIDPNALIRDVIEKKPERVGRLKQELVFALRSKDVDNLCFTETEIRNYIDLVESRFHSTEDSCVRILADFLFDANRINWLTTDIGKRLGKDEKLSSIVRDELNDNIFRFFNKLHQRVFEPLQLITDNGMHGEQLGITLVNVFPFVVGQMRLLQREAQETNQSLHIDAP